MHNFKFYDKDNNKIDVYYIIEEKQNSDDIFYELESLRGKWNIKKQLIEYDQKIQLIKDMNNEVLFAYWKYNDDDDDDDDDDDL